MPIIETDINPAPLAILGGNSTLSANAGGLSHLQAIIAGNSTFFASGGNLTLAAANLSGGSALSAFGRIGDEPNVFGAVELVGGSALYMFPKVVRRGVAVLSGSSGLTARAFRAISDPDEMTIFLTIAADFVRNLRATYGARIFADGVSVPIKSFNYNESSSVAGLDAGFTLARQSDRATVETSSNFDFDIFDGSGWKNLFSDGRQSSVSFGFGMSGEKTSDSGSFSTAAPVAAQLDKSPTSNLTIYDPERLTLNASDFEKTYDSNGGEYVQQLAPVSNLTLYGLMQIVFVELCGFTEFKTNLPDFAIRRADFAETESYLDGIAGHIGFYNPLIFVRDSVIWLLDATATFPAGFAAPVALTADRYVSADLRADNEQIDGFNISYSQDEREFDYYNDRLEQDDPDEVGNYGSPGYMETTRSRTIREFFKSSAPFAPVRAEKISEKTEIRAVVSGGLTLINRETETFVYDSFNRVSAITNEVFALVPNLIMPNFDPEFTKIKEIKTSFFYRPDIFDPRRQIMYSARKVTRGLTAIDEENTHLDKPFKQDFSDANRAGNLRDGMTVEFETIQVETQNLKQSPGGELEYRTKVVNFLTEPAAASYGSTDSRSGDVSVNGITTGQKTIKVLRAGAVRTNTKLKPLAIAELPIRYGVQLARRRLELRNKKRGSVTLVGIDTTMRRGSVFTLYDRNGAAVGNFIVEGFSIAAQNLGLRDQRTAQILEVSEIGVSTAALAENTSGNIRVAPGGEKTFSLDIKCRTDYKLTATAPADITIFAKAEPGDTFQDITATPFDLSPFAPEIKTFYFKITADGGATERDDLAGIRVGL